MKARVAPYLAGLTGKGVGVAIVDSGVHAAHPHVGGVAGGIAVRRDGTESDDYVDRIGHGTAVAAAIRDQAPAIDLYAVKIFDGGLSIDIDTLVRAIDRACRFDVTVINLSLGTDEPEHQDLLAEATQRAHLHGVVIVSPERLGDELWWPGSLPDVLGVQLDWECPREAYRVNREGGKVSIAASGYPRDIPGVPRERNLKGISFAAANVTGFVARALELHPSAAREEIIEILRNAAAQ